MGERKYVTVLFADVVGSMSLAATMDAERLREIMHELFNRAAAVVQRYQGTVDKFTGDGLMALFGAPAALEDHALRACLSALEIQEAAAALGDEVRDTYGIDLRVRVGLNSGEVVAGDVGAGPGRYTAVGRTVGLAQRMESAAHPGTVLCTERTAQLAGSAAVFGTPREVRVKGLDEPLTTRVLERIDPGGDVLGRDDGPLIGRDVEMAALLRAFEPENAHCVGIMGDPGQGKSRLVREFTSAVRESGAEVIVARCEAHTTHVPLYAVARLLTALTGVRGLSPAAARVHVADLMPESCESADVDIVFELLSIGERRTQPTSGTESRRKRIAEIVARLVAARPARVVIVLEDLHWVDPASEEAIAKLVEALRDTESMVLVTFRPVQPEPLHVVSDSTVVLRALADADAVALAMSVLGPGQGMSNVGSRIADLAGGNPFFVEEIVHDLVDRELLLGQRGDYRITGPVESIGVPRTVQAVLAARIDRLSVAQKELLNAASVIGTGFDVEVLASVLPSVDNDAMNGLVAAELIDEVQLLPLRRYRFRHPLVRSVAYESQLVTARQASHRRLAQTIQARAPGAIGQNAALIGSHLHAAGELTGAYEWYMRSAEWFRRRDVVAARQGWMRAMQAADGLPKYDPATLEKRCLPRAQMNLTSWLVPAMDDDARLFDELRVLTSSAESPELLRCLALGMAGRLTTLIITEGDTAGALALAGEVEAIYPTVECPPTDRAEILTSVAMAHYEAGQFDRALAPIMQLDDIEEHLTGYDLVPPLSMGGVIAILKGDRAAGRLRLDRAIRLSREADPVDYSIALAFQMDLVVLGFDIADEHLVAATGDAVRRTVAFGDAYGMSLARWAHGTALLMSDPARRDEAVEYLEQSRSDGLDLAGCLLDAQLADTRYGAVEPAVYELYDLVAAELSSGSVAYVGYATSILVRLLVDAGGRRNVDRAHDIVERLDRAVANSDQALRLWPLNCRMTLARINGDREFQRSRDAYRELAVRLDARGHLRE